MENKKEYYYILNLTKMRIFFISSSLILFLCVIFLSGLFIGKFTTKLNNNPNDKITQLNPNSSGVPLNLNTSPLNHHQTSQKTYQQDYQQNSANNSFSQKYSQNKTKPIKKQQNSFKKDKKYYIQVFATQNKKKAKGIYKDLKVRKYPANVKIIKKGNKNIFIIRVGLYQKKTRAFRHLKLIKTKFPRAFLRTT